eukprot:TRINITY_DN189_c0_g1_i1.p1 TRINITY_DN189_c0_g1~~TRINITY_DN189_c0_g1_i1.p1  ORF type:complete len:1015 (-),score=199.89 TRINITY_DN189_c0_g1_i1:105-3149(-)
MQNCSAVDETLSRQLGVESPCFVAQLLPQLMDLVRASRRLPIGEQHAIRRGSKDFLQASKELGQRSLSAAHRTLRFVDPANHSSSKPDELTNFNMVIDSIDSILERADTCLRDAMNASEPSSASGGHGSGSALGSNASAPLEDRDQEGLPQATPAELRRAASYSANSSSNASRIPKPQVRWRHLVDNARLEFVPRLLVKHNQKVALQPQLLDAQRRAGLRGQGGSKIAESNSGGVQSSDSSALLSHLDKLGVGNKNNGGSSLPHPYDEELRSLQWPDAMFQPREAKRFLRMEDTPLVWVRTADELRAMISELKTCVGGEIAIDVEHHDFRSYRGFVCLVQISTRQKDFIVDPFDIFEEMHLLNEVFTDPRIIKVLHGADRDVTWLQRDFSVYIVGMFDTGQAARMLKLQGGFSLANLVQTYCGIKLDKKYQTADWRERPLLPEMVHYARMDTHFLLYIYDCVRNALLLQQSAGRGAANIEGLQATEDGRQALQTVLDRSTALCGTVYSESRFDSADAAMRLCERFGMSGRPLETKQFNALQALVGWRDRLARDIDESLNYIAPDSCLWRIALALPNSATRLRSTCNPLPPMLQQKAQEVVDLLTGSENGVQATLSRQDSSQSAKAAVAAKPPSNQAGGVLASKPDNSPSEEVTPLILRPWPTRSSASVRPVVHVCAGDGARSAHTHSKIASLADMFDMESSDDDDDEKMANLDELSFVVAAPSPPPSALATPTDASIADAGLPTPKPAATPDPSKAPGSTVLRDAYGLPAPGRKKKVKKAVGAAAPAAVAATPAASPGEAGVPAAATVAGNSNAAPMAGIKRKAPPIASGASPAASSFDAEAALFRSALAGAGATAAAAPATSAAGGAASSQPVPAAAAASVDVASNVAVTPAPKKKRKKIAAAAAPAGAAAAPAAAAPAAPAAAAAAAPAVPAVAAATVPPAPAAAAAAPAAVPVAAPAAATAPAAVAAATGAPAVAAPKKKKKKKIVPQAAVAEETPALAVSDPYAADDPYM